MNLPQAGQTMQAGISNSVVFGKHVKRNVHSDLTTLVPIGPSKKSLAKLDPSSFDNSRLKNHSITSQKNIVQSDYQFNFKTGAPVRPNHNRMEVAQTFKNNRQPITVASKQVLQTQNSILS